MTKKLILRLTVVSVLHYHWEQHLGPRKWKSLTLSNSLRPHGLYSPWNSPGQNIGMGSLSLTQGLSNPGTEPRSPTLQVDSLQAEPQGKPKNTGVCSLFLLQGIFPTQELNQSLLHCRQVLYQLSYQESPWTQKLV